MPTPLATTVKLGHGSALQRESATGSGTYADVAEVRRISFKRGAKMVDVTHLQSPSMTEEFIDGLKKAATIDLDLNFLPVHVTQGATSGLQKDLETEPQPARNYKLYVNGVTNPYTFSAKIVTFDAELDPARELTAKLTLQAVGATVQPTS